MNLAPIIERLKSQVIGLNIVGGAAGIAAASVSLPAAPAAYVIEEKNTTGENEIANDVHQRVEVTLSVFLAVKNAKDSRGESGQGDLETLRQAARDALLGWSPQSGVEPLTYMGGELFRFEPGHIWWREGWRTAHYIRSAI